MKHLVVSIYTAAKLTGLLQIRDLELEYDNLKIPTSWQVSVCRICVTACSAMIGSTVAIYRGFATEFMAEHKKSNARIAPIKDGKATIGAVVTFDGGEATDIIWRGDRANLELGVCVAELTLDRPRSNIIRIRSLPSAERYYTIGCGRLREYTNEQIAELLAATISARKAANGEKLSQEMRTVANASKNLAAEVVQDLTLTSVKRREVIAALMLIHGPVQSDGTIEVSPIDWNDQLAADRFNVDSRLIRELRESLAIRVKSLDVALNDAANALQAALDAPLESSTYDDVDRHARSLLSLLRL